MATGDLLDASGQPSSIPRGGGGGGDTPAPRTVDVGRVAWRGGRCRLPDSVGCRVGSGAGPATCVGMLCGGLCATPGMH